MRVAPLLLVAACVDQGSPTAARKIDPLVIEAHLLKAAPDGLDHLDVALGGGVVTYLGATFDQKILPPGQLVHARFYWRVDRPVTGEWRVFTMVRGAPNTADFMNLPASDMQLGHPVATWRPGEIIEDAQDITLRPDWKSPIATIQLGLIQAGGHTPGERMAAQGPHVVDRAIVAKTFDVDLAKAPPPPDTIYIRHAAGPIAIDGSAGEPGWAGAVLSPEFQQAEGCGESLGKAQAKMMWDETNLYLFVSITDPDIVSPFTKHDEHLWEADDVEIFIDADSNKRTYVELQVNPNNATFDSYFSDRGHPNPAWDSHMVTAVQKRTTHQPQGDVVSGWDAEIAIPWEDVKGLDTTQAIDLPPKVGQRWRLNVVRVDKTTEGKQPWASSWNRITCSDWHALDRMLTAVFADVSGSIIPTATPVAPVAPAGSGSAGSGSAGSGSAGSAVAPVRPVMMNNGSAARIEDIRTPTLGAEVKPFAGNPAAPVSDTGLHGAHTPTTTAPPPAHEPGGGSGTPRAQGSGAQGSAAKP